jgi:HK97 family phage prohead protease|tara:strand:- start:517 stop:1335 length:819 start_codon:yes stop_codon:yes gene_type:complete
MKTEYIKGLLKKSDDGKFQFIASDETKDRHGEVIPIASWDLKNFNKAPRLLVDHDHRVEKIVGKASNMRIEKSDKPQLVFDAIFHEITELSREVKEMVVNGFLDTVSVGFIPHEPEGDGDISMNELVEVSLVTVPANPNAGQIKSLMEKEEKSETKKQIEKFVAPACDKSAQMTITSIKEVKGEYEVVCMLNGEEKIYTHVLIPGQDINGESVAKIVDKPAEKHVATQQDKGRSNKGRSLSSSDRKLAITRRSLKEAVKIITFALSEVNKDK